jgi:replicative DNA helicase
VNGAAPNLITEHLPPQSLEAEMSALGAAFISAEAVDTLLTRLEPGDFYPEAHRKLVEVVAYLHGQEQPVDVLSVPEELRRRGWLDRVGGIAYIATLAESVPTAAHQKYYCEIVAEKSGLRKFWQGSSELRGLIDRGASLEEVLQYVAQMTDRAAARKGMNEPVSARELAKAACERYWDENSREGVPTGLQHLQRVTRGWQDTDLIILAGRPSMGKTAAALHFSLAAAREESGVLFFSIEMSKEQLTDRMLCTLAEVPGDQFRDRALSSEDIGRLNRAFGRLGDLAIDVEESSDLDLLQVRATARRWRRQHPGKALIILDYLQLLQPPARSDSKADAIEQNANGLKAMAKELGCPVLVLSQLNRENAQEKNHRPQLHHLRGSGGIEQAADLVVFIHRESYYAAAVDRDGNLPVTEQEWPQTAEFILAKHRNGATGTVWCEYDGRTGRFGEISTRHGDADAPPARVRDRWGGDEG